MYYRCSVPGCARHCGLRQWVPESTGRAGALALCHEHEGIDFEDLRALRSAAGISTPDGDALLIEEAHYIYCAKPKGDTYHPERVVRKS
jgi:hypothetical protein